MSNLFLYYILPIINFQRRIFFFDTSPPHIKHRKFAYPSPPKQIRCLLWMPLLYKLQVDVNLSTKQQLPRTSQELVGVNLLCCLLPSKKVFQSLLVWCWGFLILFFLSQDGKTIPKYFILSIYMYQGRQIGIFRTFKKCDDAANYCLQPFNLRPLFSNLFFWVSNQKKIQVCRTTFLQPEKDSECAEPLFQKSGCRLKG